MTWMPRVRATSSRLCWRASERHRPVGFANVGARYRTTRVPRQQHWRRARRRRPVMGHRRPDADAIAASTTEPTACRFRVARTVITLGVSLPTSFPIALRIRRRLSETVQPNVSCKSTNAQLTSSFRAPPAGFEPATCGLGTLQSGRVFDQVRHGDESPSGTVIPKPSQNCGSLVVSGGKLIGGR